MIEETTRLVQLIHNQFGRRIALVMEPELVLLNKFKSVYEISLHAIQSGIKLKELIRSPLSDEVLHYDSIYGGYSEWKLLPSFDHPFNPFACLISGTGLTHKNSALNRQMMHKSEEYKLTDSMQMYQWGMQGGFPEKGSIGMQPEWFYKGNGYTLKAHGKALEVPPYGNDGGEEPEVAGIYIVDENGKPWRIGFSTGNEFSDHVMEKKNYLYLAPSKLRNCAIGPELIIDTEFKDIQGKVSISRDERSLWSADIKTGEKNMAHSLANLEYHHFKYLGHRIPLQTHVHFLGADAFSFGSQVQLQSGDVMIIQWNGLGRALQNTLEISDEKETIIVPDSVT